MFCCCFGCSFLGPTGWDATIEVVGAVHDAAKFPKTLGPGTVARVSVQRALPLQRLPPGDRDSRLLRASLRRRQQLQHVDHAGCHILYEVRHIRCPQNVIPLIPSHCNIHATYVGIITYSLCGRLM